MGNALQLFGAGGRCLDTANNYAGGRSERLLGDAIRRAGGLPDGKLVYSKADRHMETGAFDGDRVRASLSESLERLGLDHLPLYQFTTPSRSGSPRRWPRVGRWRPCWHCARRA